MLVKSLRLVLLSAAAVTGLLLVPPVLLHGQVAVRNQGFVPFSDDPINYRSEPDDPVARLQQRLDRGEATLQWEPRNSYLRSLLQQLGISETSQTLVFSKTSFQYRKISPATPRALYFNDDVYVGRVHDGKALEIVSFDARQGAMFYLLDEQPATRPAFQRAELDCTVCHVAPATRNVPGVLLRSIYPMPTGSQAARTPAYVTGHDSPLSERFGGWYVTGTVGAQRHLGNGIVRNTAEPMTLTSESDRNVTDLSDRFDTSPYLTPHSDIVAQLVQAHQTQAHNLITVANYRTRMALHEEAAANRAAGRPLDTLSAGARTKIAAHGEELLRYLLFTDEAPLSGAVTGTAGFQAQFEARGPRDSRGRSLRDFDLQTRLFRYPLSYLIYTDSFDALPEPAKGYVYARLLEVLTGDPSRDEFWNLSKADRQAVLEILLETKPGLPEAWSRNRQTAAPDRQTARRSTGR